MIICTPLRNAENVEELVEAGAGEFYAGLDTTEWQRKYGTHVEMNKRGIHGRDANFQGLDELGNAVDRAHALNTPLMLAMNQLQYTASQLPLLREVLTSVQDIGVDGVILADLNLILIARQLGLRVAVSTLAAAANYHSYAFYRQLGVFRIITTRDMRLEDLAALRAAFPDLGMEVFMANAACKLTEGVCFGIHTRDRFGVCNVIVNSKCNIQTHSGKPVPMAAEAMFIRNHTEYTQLFRLRGCGLCGVWRLIRMGVDSCKLVGRELPIERIKCDLRAIARTIRLAREAATEEDFLSSVQPPFEDPTLCSHGYQCYFPQVRRPALAGFF